MSDFSTALPPDEQTLISQAQQGNRDAFGELVLHHYQGVVNVVFRLSGDIALAEDVAQETFIRAWQKMHTYQPIGRFRNWLYRIATNLTMDVFRRQHEMLDVDMVELPNPELEVEQLVEANQETALVRQAVLALPLGSRSVLILREYSGLSYQEISETLEIPVGTVMSRLNYARMALKKVLAVQLEVV